jgi:ankyrin repeat protein
MNTRSMNRHNEAFFRACSNGNLTGVIQLLSKFPSIDICASNNKAFRFACANGHQELAQWLETMEPSINVSAGNDYALRYACENGHRDVVWWLLTTFPSIDICAIDNYAFRYACANGHLPVARLLLSRSPISMDIGARNDYAFTQACVHCHLDVAQWLCSLDPKKYSLQISESGQIDYTILELSRLDKILETGTNINFDDVCMICIDTISEIKTNCGHVFCKSCLSKYMNEYNKSDCPTCRQEITNCFS